MEQVSVQLGNGGEAQRRDERECDRVTDLLAAARSRFRRVTAAEVSSALADGALVIDTRPIEQRVAGGEIPNAVVVARNVLEWRLDPSGEQRIPELRDANQPVIVVCQQGYASSLAAASLLDIGLTRATDLDGGFEAWIAAGLPVVPAGSCTDRTAPT
jgi:rhodanese-related sulfurtransferase